MHSCEIKNQIIKLRIIFVIHDLVIQLFRIKKILWSYDFDLADSYDLMICMTGFFVIQYKKTRDPMIPTWKKLVILWSRNEHYSWSRDLKKKKICDLVISKFGKLLSRDLKMQQPHDLVISDLKKNDRMIWELIILWSHYLWDCNICDPRNFSSCWTIFAAVEKKYSTLGNLNSRPIRNTKVRAEAVGLYFSWWNICST